MNHKIIKTMPAVVLVDETDHPIGVMEKTEAHRLGLLHRAFSILIYNSKGEMLLQQRADHKYHSGGLWTNACCSHPRPGEEIVAAAHRRLKEEINLQCDLTIIGHFIYKHQFEENLFEHEYDYVLKGICDVEPVINKDEVKAFKWISIKDLSSDMMVNPEQYTFWFKEICSKILIY